MKKVIAVFLTAIMLSFIPVNAEAATANKPCSSRSVNKVSAGLVCKKVGKVYRWQVIATKPKPSATPTPSATPKPPVVVTPNITKNPEYTFKNELPENVRYVFEEAIKEIAKSSAPGTHMPKISVYIEDGYPAEYSNRIVEGIKATLKRYAAYTINIETYSMIFALTPSFAEEKINLVQKENNLNESIDRYRTPNWNSMFNPKDDITRSTNTMVGGHIVQIFQAKKGYKGSPDDLSKAVHEAWHPIIHSYTKGSWSPQLGVCWASEGGASLIGDALAWDNMSLKNFFAVQMVGSMVRYPQPILDARKLEGSSERRTIDFNNGESCGAMGGYDEGEFIAAGLIAFYGWDKFMKFSKLDYMMQPWYNKFKEIYGFEVEDFYNKINPILKEYVEWCYKELGYK